MDEANSGLDVNYNEWITRDVPANDETAYITPDYEPELDAPKGPFQYQRVPIIKYPSGTIRKRWCPTHRRHEDAVVGERLRCGPAWAEQYALERAAVAESMNPNESIIKLGESIATLAEEIRYGERVIAEPPTRPVPPPPTQPRPQPRLNPGRGGVALP
tara:strand:- start:510 stop:986 length:477 start_codon:yes stop_codon:yes gene_type:complete